jgi:TonB family protein
MSTAIRTSGRPTPNSRRVPRCPLSVPVRVTMRNATGIQGIPGRSLDLGEGGIAAILAGMVNLGDSVGVEFLLPEMGLGLHAKAVVRHQDDLRCGLEFFGLSLEQQAMIRRWTRRMLEKPAASPAMPVSAPPVEVDAAPQSRFQVSLAPVGSEARARHRGKWLGRVLLAVGISAIAVALVAWRYWHMEWVELQQQADAVAATSVQRVNLPPGAIDLLTVHKVDAVLPEGQTNQDAITLLHIVVAADGTVIDARPENGNELFNRAAMDAVKEWRFQPYRVNGAPAEIETTVAVDFH